MRRLDTNEDILSSASQEREQSVERNNIDLQAICLTIHKGLEDTLDVIEVYEDEDVVETYSNLLNENVRVEDLSVVEKSSDTFTAALTEVVEAESADVRSVEIEIKGLFKTYLAELQLDNNDSVVYVDSVRVTAESETPRNERVENLNTDSIFSA